MDIMQWVTVILTGIGAFSTIATITPNESDDKVSNCILKIINLLAMNFGKAKNEE